jgi:hypothetical protein
MKRDMDLIRDLLLKLEKIDVVSPGDPYVDIPVEALAVKGFTDEEVALHLRMLENSRFIETDPEKPIGTWILRFRQISWQGREFLDTVRDPEIWAKTKKGAEEAKGFTIDLLKDLAKGLVKKQIEELTGVKL